MSILMEDLLKEITSLSTRLGESQSDSNSTSEIGSQNLLANQGIDSLQMRNRTRSRKRRGRKRRMDCHPELYSESENSCADSSEDGAIRDYIENITSIDKPRPAASDTDEDFVPRRKVINLLNGVPWSPLEVGESDSFSENVMSISSRKKRKIKKMNKKLKALESLEQIVIPADGELNVKEKIGQLRRELEQKQTKKLKKRKQKTMKNVANMSNMETDLMETPKQKTIGCNDNEDDDMKGSDSSSEEDVESVSSGINEADDEGEESCVEAAVSAAIPYWDDEDMCEDAEEREFKMALSQSFGVLSEDYKEDLQRELKKYHSFAAPKLNGNGNFAACTNKRIRAFLQHDDENEFCLNASCEAEQDQILELASLYSLCCLIKDTPTKKRLLLTKTKQTREPDRRMLRNYLKRRETRKTRPLINTSQRWSSKRRKTVTNEATYSTENAAPIPESNVGNKMLQGMGWVPGTGLGRDSSGIVKPVAAHKRPKKLGLGYPS